MCYTYLLFNSCLRFGLADLQLDVKGCRDVYASFDKYVEVERLEGDNKYQAEQHGLQVPTNHFPTMVLNLNLNMFYFLYY
jgi:ubiquitin carboxyl-terminal hydrolase 7